MAEYGGRERVLAWIAGRDWALPYPAIVTGVVRRRGASRSLPTTWQRLPCSSTKAAANKPSTGPNPDADGDGLILSK